MKTAVAASLIVVIVMSVASFIAYGLDKRQAKRTLHMMAFLGGWPGALMAQRQFRHKTQKLTFRIVFWIVVVLHVGIVGAVAYALIALRQA